MRNHLNTSSTSISTIVRLALSAAVAITGVAMTPAAHGQPPEKFAAGRILVSPRAGLPAKEFDKIIKTHGAHAARKLGNLNVYLVDMPPGREKALLQALERNPHVRFAELDGEASGQMIPADTYYASSWHLPKIAAPAAWDIATGSGVTIAILDGGVEATHPDLAARMVPGWNFYDNNSNTSDVTGHGTKVAGVAAAIGNNSLGATGGAWNAKVMPMRITDPSGSITYYSTVANALSWAADRGARVANISFIVSHVASVQTAAQYMRSKGGTVVASSGNSGAYIAHSNAPSIITVGGTTSTDARASWSAYGPIVDVTAPGASIYTTARGGAYGAYSGTSFASPLTASVVALMLSANPALQPSQVDSILASSSDDLGTAGRDDYFGHGRINAGRAVAAAKATTTTDTSVPVVSASVPSTIVTGITTVSATATDNIGVARVELYAGTTLVASDSAAPYSFSWDSSTRADGAVSLVVKAYDAAGNVGSKALSVTVANNSTIDTIAPVVTVGNPKPGTTVSGNVAVTVSASDNVAVTSTSLYIDGALKASGNGALSYTWNTRKARGIHTVSATARDAAGNSKTESVQVTVK